MSSLPMEVIEVVGQTMVKVVPVTIALALVFTVLSYFWACNPGKPWWRKRELDPRHLLLVLRAGVCAHLPHRAAGARRRHPLRHSRAGPTGGILRQWPRAAVAASALGAGDIVPRCVRLHAVLAAPHVSRRRLLEISRHPSFFGGSRVDLRGAVPSRQPVHRNDPGRRHPADRRHFSQHHAVGRAVHDLPFRLRSRQPELDVGPFKYVLATPVFHRWHHTPLEEGGNTNFAGTFPLWDLLFGTYRMPEHRLPDNYGVDDQEIPAEIAGQLAYPFRH